MPAPPSASRPLRVGTFEGLGHRLGLGLGLLTMLLAGVPPPATAQTVTGRVLDAATGEPLAGAFVVLEDAGGARRGGFLVGAEGRFIFRPGRPGDHRLVVELIGYGGTRSDLFPVAEAATVERTLRVEARAISLEGIGVSAGTRCEPGPGSGPATARLWDEARKALEVARWTEAREALSFEVEEVERELDAATLRVRRQETEARTGWYDSSPYRAIPQARLEADGYVQPTEDGAVDYWAPDAGVLLSDGFLRDHCFRVSAPHPEEPGWVGLAFEPVPARDLPDIEGVMWLDRSSAELRRLDFRYVRLPFEHGDWPQVGGQVDFHRLPTGMWIVDRWHIRMPLEARTSGGFGRSRATRDLVSLEEVGAVIRSVRGADGSLVARFGGAVLHGVVRGGVEGGPLEGARVRIPATGGLARTGADGTYRIDDLPGGRYTVVLSHPELSVAGVPPVVREVELREGATTSLELEAVLSPSLAAELCAGMAVDPALPARAHPVLLHGRVEVPGGGTPVPHATVRVERVGSVREIRSDSLGVWRTCLSPAPEPVTLVARLPASPRAHGTAPSRTVTVVEPGFVRVDLEVPERVVAHPRTETSHRGRRWTNAVLGTVVDEATGGPVEAAMATLRYPDGQTVRSVLTDGAGRFTLTHPDLSTDTFRLAVEHVAYGSASGTVRFPPGEEITVEVLLAPRALALDPITVTARRRGFLADAGFYERRERGWGIFLEREDFEARPVSRVTQLLVGKPRVTVVRMGAGREDLRILGAGRGGFGGSSCQPAIWLDGALVRDGGAPRGRPGAPDQPQLTDLVAPHELEALEVHAGIAGVPVAFRGSNTSCGVVLVWTRRR